MSKVEKFIQESTKRCSDGVRPFEEWLTPFQARTAVKIAREEICKWLQENAHKYSTVGLYTDAMITDLKQALKDE